MIINNVPMIFLYYKEGVPREKIDVFLNLRMRHFHYITNSEFREVGVLGMSESEQMFAFGFSKMLEDFSREEINDMEETFASLGWKLRTD